MTDKNIRYGTENFVDQGKSNIKEDYEVDPKPLGSGGYGTVFKGKNKKTGAIRAIKKLITENINKEEEDRFKREIELLKTTDHPNIIKLYEVYYSKRSIYLVMEKCDGGELFDDLIKRMDCGLMYTEKEVATIIKQVMLAVEYCHSNGICHRDLKPENLLFLKNLKIDSGHFDEKKKPIKVQKIDEIENPIKVIDFGLSKLIKHDLVSKVGTAYYVAPEILEGDYDEKCDIWSAGVILYILLCGDPPFNGANDQIIYTKIKAMKYTFSDKFKNVSDEAKDLIRHMLVPQKERYNAKQVLEHNWFDIVKDKPLKELDFDPSFLKEYRSYTHLKKLVLLYIASRINDKEINQLKKAFKAFDKNNDGEIDYEEFRKGLSQLKSDKISEKEISEYFSSIDTDKNKKISYTEFLAATINKKSFLQRERLMEAFSMLDKEKKGKITKDELKQVLNLESSDDEYIVELMKAVDTNKDGYIDQNEFFKLMGYNEK